MNNLFHKTLILILALFSYSLPVAAQSGISAFLFSATLDPELGIYSNQISYLSQQPYRLAPFRELEYRTQTNEVGANELEHALRLSPANPLEIRYSRKVFSSYQNLLSIQRELALNEILLERYLLATNLLYLNELQGNRASLVQTLESRISIMEKQSSSGFFDAEEFVKLKLEQMEEFADLESTEFAVANKIKEIEKLTALEEGPIQAPDWTYAKVISLDKIEYVVDSLLQQPLFTNLLAYHKEKIKFAENEYKLKKWDINPGFIQGSYRQYQQAEGENPLGFSLGLTIPVFNPNKGKIAEQRLEILEAENELGIEQQKAEEKVEKLLASLKSSLQRYRNLEEQMNSYDINKLLSGVNLLNQENPSIRLKFDAQLLKIEKVQIEVKNEIFETYIELLFTADMLAQRPLQNFLSNELEEF